MEKRFKVTVDGKAYDVTIEDLTEGGNLYPSPSLNTQSVPTSPVAPVAPPPPTAAGPAGENDLASPLAGVVVELLVGPGQVVAAGDKVVIIEAMKMKTQINAHKSGRVTAVGVAIGDGVEAGQALITIE